MDLPTASSDEWYTPARFVDLARAVMGSIDADPASCVEAQTVVRAATSYTLETDGLAHEWPGRVFLNPPYSNPAPWIAKLLAELDASRATEAIVLVNARTSSVWWASLASRACRCDVRGRVKFWRPERPEGSAGRMGSVFFYVGPNVARFAEVFRSVGIVTARRNAVCAECSGPIDAARADALYCRSACRQRAYRRRQAAPGGAFDGGATLGQGQPANEPSEAPTGAAADSDHGAGQSRNVA